MYMDDINLFTKNEIEIVGWLFEFYSMSTL